jgi:hypothetical protein
MDCSADAAILKGLCVNYVRAAEADRARDALVAARTELINTTRGTVKSMGRQLPSCSSRSFASQAEKGLPVEIREALLPLVHLADALES